MSKRKTTGSSKAPGEKRYTRPVAAKGIEPYRDISDPSRRMPLVLWDGTSVEFPGTWTMQEAENWRRHAGPAKPAAQGR